MKAGEDKMVRIQMKPVRVGRTQGCRGGRDGLEGAIHGGGEHKRSSRWTGEMYQPGFSREPVGYVCVQSTHVSYICVGTHTHIHTHTHRYDSFQGIDLSSRGGWPCLPQTSRKAGNSDTC